MKTIKHKTPAGDYAIDCYGVLTDESNILVSSSLFEEIHENWNYETEEPFQEWSEVVEFLLENDSYIDLEELSVC